MDASERIERLRTEAAQAGDLGMVAICDVALGREPDEDMDLTDEENARIETMTREQAQAECKRVLDEAAART